MKKIYFILPALITIIFPLSARADVQSCTKQIIRDELSSGPHRYESGKIIKTESHQGVNYHLIFLDGGWKEVELVIKENNQLCEKVVYNPTGHYINYSQQMPKPVATVLFQEKAKYSKAMWERKKATQEHQ